jgi:transposase
VEASEEKRTEYLKKLKKIAPENRVYIDESGMDGNACQERAWGKRGELIKAKKSGKYYLRTNIIAGLVNNQSIAPFVFNGSCDTELFNKWVEIFLIKELKPGQTVILDNASFHKSIKTKELLESVGCKLLFLPPYSPDLNPIEKFWATMKRWIRRRVTQVEKLFDTVCSFFSVSNSS